VFIPQHGSVRSYQLYSAGAGSSVPAAIAQLGGCRQKTGIASLGAYRPLACDALPADCIARDMQAVGLQCVAWGMPAEGRDCVARGLRAVGLQCVVG
jgi:hypothetical protein